MPLRPPHPRKQEALEMLRGGATVRQVAEALGIKAGTLRQWKRREARSVTGSVTEGVTESAPNTPSNVIPIHEEKRGKKRERDREGEEQARARRRARDRVDTMGAHLAPVEAIQAAKEMVAYVQAKLRSGMVCPRCDETDQEELSARDFVLYTKAYVQHLDSLTQAIDFEERVAKKEGRQAEELDLDDPQTIIELGESLRVLGPRRLIEVLKADDQAARVVRAALAGLERSTG